MPLELKIGALLIGSYLLGSLPFGLWVARIWKGIDIRTVGSGNIGATNVGRVCGRQAFAVVFVLDCLKGLLPPLVGHYLLRVDSGWQVLAALLAIVGHNFSIFLGFQGGKGIATGCGTLFGLVPINGFIAAAIFLIEMATLGYVSLGSLIATLSVPLLIPFFYPGDPYRLAYAIIGSAIIFYKHRANIQRLWNGTEPKVRLFAKKTPALSGDRSEKAG
jgi:glycerol-3-phosphate acyltransferase PlsY